MRPPYPRKLPAAARPDTDRPGTDRPASNRCGRRLLTLAALLAAGCFNPTFPTGQPCSESEKCPPGQRCTEGICVATDVASSDGGIDGNDSGPLDVVHVAVGSHHTCAALADGTARCWGSGADGRLGYGDELDVGASMDRLPSLVGAIDVGASVDKLALGDRHTCALLSDGNVRCWGSNDLGQLGSGVPGQIIGDDETPANQPVVDLMGPASDLVAYRNHTCAALDQSGVVQCWGEGGPHLGLGPAADHLGDDETPGNTVLTLGNPVQSLDVGAAHSCALTEPGGVYCWGLGTDGRLGYNNPDPQDTVPPMPVALGAGIVQVSAGEAHTCARRTDGAALCWGLGLHGRLGHGNTDSIGDDPGDAFDIVSLGGDATGLAAGGSHSCALMDGGGLRCWGNAMLGRLGQGQDQRNIGDDELPSSVPLSSVVELDRDERVVGLAAGDHHSCILVDGGPTDAIRRVRCFGSGESGALGYGNTNDVGDNEVVFMVGDVPLF